MSGDNWHEDQAGHRGGNGNDRRRHSQRIDRHELIDQSRGVPAPTSQGTTIEQTRAIAQVQGALVVAQQRPRDTLRAAARMREACALDRLAEKAFFSYPRGGQTVSGPSVHLATELALCWGNVDYGIVELARNDAGHESEMLAYAWDLETNLRVTNTFIVPHKRDKTGGFTLLVDQRDIYENNANNAARRLRECLFRCMPKAFTEEAQEICRDTLVNGGGVPLAKRREDLLVAFRDLFGISRTRIEKRAGRAAGQFTAYDIGELKIAFRSLKTGEGNPQELFPDDAADKANDAFKEKAAQSQGEGHQPPTTGQGSDARADQTSQAGDGQSQGDGQSDLLGTATTAERKVTLLVPGAKKAEELPFQQACERALELASERSGRQGAGWIRMLVNGNEWLPATSPTYAALEAEVARCEGA